MHKFRVWQVYRHIRNEVRFDPHAACVMISSRCSRGNIPVMMSTSSFVLPRLSLTVGVLVLIPKIKLRFTQESWARTYAKTFPDVLISDAIQLIARQLGLWRVNIFRSCMTQDVHLISSIMVFQWYHTVYWSDEPGLKRTNLYDKYWCPKIWISDTV